MKKFMFIFSKSFFSIMIGMMVFGLMDNGIMVIAGDSIDKYISSFGFSTMFSAGLGNTISDAIGVISGSLVARSVHSLIGKPDPDAKQSLVIFAEALGVIIGCLLGLLPLIFL